MRCDPRNDGFRMFGPGNFPEGRPMPEGGTALSTELFIMDKDACRKLCMDNPRCKSYAYNDVERKCRTFDFASRCGILTKKKNGKDLDFDFW